MKQIRKRLTYANVMSSIAVFLVLGGGAAFAATKLAKNSVGTNQIRKEAVTAGKIKNAAVIAAKIGGGAVGTQQLAKAAVTNEKLAANAVNAGILANNSVTTAKVAKNAINAEKLAANSVTAEKLAANAVTNTKIENNAVSSTKIANGSVGASKLGTITQREASGEIAANAQNQVLAACNAGERLLSIGAFWDAQLKELSIQSELFVGPIAAVRGNNNSAAIHTLTVQAICLAP